MNKQFRKVAGAGAVGMLGLMLIAGCQNKNHPDEKAAVTNSLSSNQLSDVSVSQDQEKGIITLTGNVQTDQQKSQAETLARQSAPDYTIANEIGVRPPAAASQASAVDSKLDDGIEDNFKAAIKGNKALNDQSIDCKAKNGTLVLSGSVKTEAQKKEAEKLAKKVPNVQQVVNEITVKPKKHSTKATM
ncbi:BON domain-containing protein [Acidipila rosea]|uniref:Hyperosmotically inducible protein n=1 Tax=Acidipila rosea TaxID=768535 RepID=A0A4R1KYZ6_9BACT|nr:BON domain-containing protein [Acidipila rosea]MBW4026577.1 BON domain-containing protein [Acidobacteriota bacterium]MBW4044753.1 BON domain-containing protein [Acidobacteriota bacterium]TCK69733.1 hyperosmotically inducible protein [Acidipila rosea]